MVIESEYEVKFHLYDGNEQDLMRHKNEYITLKEEFREEGSVMSRVMSYFFEGLVELIEGDRLFWDDNYNKAFEQYTAAERMFNRFKNSRNVEVRIDLLADRFINRSVGLKSMSEAFQMRDLKIKEAKFSEALSQFNEEVSIANQMEETMSSYAAFARASFAEAQLLLQTSKKEQDNNSGEAKKMLLRGRAAIRQSSFIDPRYLQYMYNIEDEIDDLTKNRILIKAENFGDQATEMSENGDYKEAADAFRKASLFYKRASSLAGDTSGRRYLLSSATIYEASELEAKGNHMFRQENKTTEAAEMFAEAGNYVDKAIALMGRFGSNTLENSFASQRDYYKAMALQCKAISMFDNEQYNEAKEIFNRSFELFDNALDSAKSGENEVIITLSEEAKGDIKGYLSMCETLI